MRMHANWAARPFWWPAMLDSSQLTTKLPRTKEVSSAREFRTRNTKSAERRRQQKKRWFKQGQKWRTGCEGRISVLKRRHGLRRCLYRGDAGMKRWVGLGVIADILHHLGTVIAERKK